MTIARQKVLTDFFDHFVTATQGKETMSKEDIAKCLEEAIRLYAADEKDNTVEIEHVKQYLAGLKLQLADVQAKHAKVTRTAHRNAGIALGLGFLGTFGQLTGMGYAIYFVWDWNTVEPWTWMFCKFALCI